MEPREIKGLEIAAKTKLTRKGKSNLWLVPSQSNKQEKYTVGRDHVRFCANHQVQFEPLTAIFFRAVLHIKPPHKLTCTEARTINRKV